MNLSNLIGGGGVSYKDATPPEVWKYVAPAKAANAYPCPNQTTYGGYAMYVGDSNSAWGIYDESDLLVWAVDYTDINASATGILGFVWYSADTVLFCASAANTLYFKEYDIVDGTPTSGGVDTSVATTRTATANASEAYNAIIHKSDASGFWVENGTSIFSISNAFANVSEVASTATTYAVFYEGLYIKQLGTAGTAGATGSVTIQLPDATRVACLYFPAINAATSGQNATIMRVTTAYDGSVFLQRMAFCAFKASELGAWINKTVGAQE